MKLTGNIFEDAALIQKAISYRPYKDSPDWSCVALECDAPYYLSLLLEMLHDGRGGAALALKDELLREYTERQTQKYKDG